MKFKILLLSLLLFSVQSFGKQYRNLGLFIASVDPITIAHTAVIEAGMSQLNLDKIIVLVNSSSNKDYSASVEERIALVNVALKKYEKSGIDFEVLEEPPEGKRQFAISRAETEGGGIIYQIAGEDVQAKAKQLFLGVPNVRTYILPRIQPHNEGGLHQLLPGFQWLESGAPLDISSTQVKLGILSGQSISNMVDPNVLQYIVESKLYFPLSRADFREKIKLIRSKIKSLNALSAKLGINPLPLDSFQISSTISTQSQFQISSLQSAQGTNEMLVRRLIAENSQLDQTQSRELKEIVTNALNKIDAQVGFTKVSCRIALSNN